MAFTSPYTDLDYSKGPKSLYYKEENVFEVVLNVPQQDDDDEWGRTLVIGQREVIDKVTDIILEVEDPFSTQTSGLINQVNALLKAVKLNNAVYTSGTTSGVQLSIGTTSISQSAAVLAGTLSVGGNTTISGTLSATGALSIGGNITQSSGIPTAKFNILKASWPTFCGTVTITEDLNSNGGSLSVQKNITAGSTITGAVLSITGGATVGTLRVKAPGGGAHSAIIDGPVTICGAVTLNNDTGSATSLVLNKTATLVATDTAATFNSVTTAGALSVSGATTVGDITVENQLVGWGATLFCGNVILSHASGSPGIIANAGPSTFKDLTISNSLTVNGSLDLSGATITSDVSMLAHTLNVSSVQITNQLRVGGNVQIGDYLYVQGLLQACGALSSDTYLQTQQGLRVQGVTTNSMPSGGALNEVQIWFNTTGNVLYFSRRDGSDQVTAALDLSGSGTVNMTIDTTP